VADRKVNLRQTLLNVKLNVNKIIAVMQYSVLSLWDKDLSRAPLAEDAVFKGPLNADELRGASLGRYENNSCSTAVLRQTRGERSRAARADQVNVSIER